MSTEPVRIGLVGYGTGGRLFHAPLIASAEGCALTAVLTRSPQRRAEVARDHPGTAVCGDLAELVAAGVEAVAVSTPVATHMDLTREAIDRGLAAVCDKPFAPDAAAARETVERATRAGVVLSVYQNRRWDSDMLTLRRLIGDGALGDLRVFESRFERFRPDPGPKAAGGGVLLDFGSHLVDQALTLFGPADRVYAELHRHAGTGLDDDFFLALRHRTGMISHLWGSSIQGAPGPRLRVTGTTGTFVVTPVDIQEDDLRAGKTPATESGQWGTEPQSRWGRIERGDAVEPVPAERGRWDTYYPAFAAAVRGSGPVPVDPADAIHALEVLEAARTSAGRGGPVPVGSAGRQPEPAPGG